VAYKPDGAPASPARHQVIEGILAGGFICRGTLAMQPCQEKMENSSASSLNQFRFLLRRFTDF
jgi:hypothetical protein